MAYRTSWLFISVIVAALVGCGDDGRGGPDSDDDDDGIPDNVAGGFEARLVGGIDPDPAQAPLLEGLLPEQLPPDTEIVNVGLVAVDGGETAELEIDVPEGGFGFTVLVYGHPGLSLIVTSAVGPLGDVLVSDAVGAGQGDFPAQFASPNRVVASVETGAFLFPNSPDVPFGPGTYRLRLGEYEVRTTQSGTTLTPSSMPVHVFVLGRAGARAPAAGSINLTLHFTGAEGLTAASAPANAELATALDVMRGAYGAIGVAIERVDYVDLAVPSLRTIALEKGTCTGGDLDELFRHSADVETHDVHLFFVERFSCMLGQFDLGQAIGGISGGIPGMPRANGTLHSGVAVSTAMFFDDPTTIAVVMAHETGHFLGLYHSQENNLFGGDPTFDNISDTADTTSGARNNLMYFSADHATTLTAGQGFVMRNNPLVTP